MKYIKDYTNYCNESLLGSLIKGIKNKLSLSFSKMFGSASEIEQLMNAYKKERMAKMVEKKAAITKYTQYIKSLKSSGEEKDQDKINQMVEDIKRATLNFDKQSDLIRQKFNIKFDEIISEEKNKKVKNYVNLKKIEMEQDLLNSEISLLLTDSGLTEEDRKNNPELNNLLNQIEIKLKKSEEVEKQEITNLKQKGEPQQDNNETGKFDLNKAKELANKTPQETYTWEKSPYINAKFNNGDKINYFSMSNRDSTPARVVQDLGQELNIKTESGNQIKIKKSAVIEKL